jgi:hypothetical protein
LLEQRVPRADDPDGYVSGRVGDNDALSIFVGSFLAIFDTDPIAFIDNAPNTVHGARSFPQSFAYSRTNPNPNPTTTTAPNPHTYATATTTKPDANPGTLAHA